MGMSIEEMKNVDVRTVDRDNLVDVTQIVIDESLSKEEEAEGMRERRGQIFDSERGFRCIAIGQDKYI